MAYYAHYRSATTGTTGCVHEFLSTPHAAMDFPPQVMYPCTLCHGQIHGFRFVFTYAATTPLQLQRLDRFCASRTLERQTVGAEEKREPEVPNGGAL